LFDRIFHSGYTGIGIVALWASILHVAGIAQLLRYNYSYIPIRFYVVLYLFTAGAVLVMMYRSQQWPKVYVKTINKTGNIFMLACCVVFASHGYLYGRWKNEIKQDNRSLSYKKIDSSKKADIVWLLLDEYGSSPSLQEQFYFHNPINAILSQKGFCVLNNIRSRFTSTLFSVNAIFNEDDSIQPSSFYSATRILEHSSWKRLLDSSGYQFVNLGFFDIGSAVKYANRSSYPQNYSDQLLSGTLFTMLYTKLEYTSAKCDSYNQEVLNRLNDTLSRQVDHARFIWAHLGIPHEPFCRNANGEKIYVPQHGENDSVLIREKYTGYVQYANSVILLLLQQHPELLQKVVIISGDHGPRFQFLRNKRYQMCPFAAVHVPKAFDTVGLKKLSYISQLPAFIMAYLQSPGNK
jgi:hypothetical protein